MWPFPVARGRRYYYTIRSTSQGNKLERRGRWRRLGILHPHPTQPNPPIFQLPPKDTHTRALHTHTLVQKRTWAKPQLHVLSHSCQTSAVDLWRAQSRVSPGVSPRLKKAAWSCANPLVPLVWPNSGLFHGYDSSPGKTHPLSFQWYHTSLNEWLLQ